jgi:hypothetical protein
MVCCANGVVGVKPGNNGSWFQYFDNAYSEVYTKGKVIYLNQNGKENELQFPDDFMPGSNSASGTVSGEMVYVGYGISAPELGYDSYKNVDVRGKIVIMETGIPYTKNDSVQLRTGHLILITVINSKTR